VESDGLAAVFDRLAFCDNRSPTRIRRVDAAGSIRLGRDECVEPTGPRRDSGEIRRYLAQQRPWARPRAGGIRDMSEGNTPAQEALAHFKDWSNYLLVTTVAAVGWLGAANVQFDPKSLEALTL